MLPWLHSLWGTAAHCYPVETTIGFGAYRVWKRWPRWKAERRAATTNDPEELKRAIQAIEAMEPRWRWPWQREE